MVSTFAGTMLERDPSLTEDTIRKFGRDMFGGDFVTPHPAATSAEIERLAPSLEVQRDWRAPTHLAESVRRVTTFLSRHTPA